MYVQIKAKFYYELLLSILSIPLIQTQYQMNSMEIEVCAQYKQTLFEIKQTYSTFVRGAPEMFHIIDKCKHYEPFIVGGRPALPKEFPPMSRLGHYNEETNETKWLCGGTLLSARYVLTAAHCFYSTEGEINRVRLGELDFSRNDEDSQPEDFGVKQTIDYPYYDDDVSLYNDIGLVELNRPVTFNSYKHPACLPTNYVNKLNEFIATGWGNTRFAGNSSNQLLKVKLDRFTDDQCRRLAYSLGEDRLASGLNESTQFCAGSTVAKDTCNGDSGGPLFVYHENFPCMYYVVGITSAGIEGCGRPNIPGIYTSVYFYINWIKNYIYA